MALEIERKYLVKNDIFKKLCDTYHEIYQGYLSRSPERTVRVRIKDNKGYITIKGITTGLSRQEFEYSVPVEDARAMLTLCEGEILHKFRYIYKLNGYVWEIDEFLDRETPLIIAEIELTTPECVFDIPDFIGKEVTGNPIYYNSNL